MISAFKGKRPKFNKTAFVHASAHVIGAVAVHEDASIWCGAALRADEDSITIGKSSNIQDNCSVHTEKGKPVVIGKNVTVGHNAVIHGCKIKDNCLIGIGAVVLTGAIIGENCIVGAGAVVTENTEIQDNSVVLGVPGRFVKNVTPKQKAWIKNNAKVYVKLKNEYMKTKKKRK